MHSAAMRARLTLFTDILDGHHPVNAAAELTAHANEVRDHGCHGTGFSSQGAMSPGGASGAD